MVLCSITLADYWTGEFLKSWICSHRNVSYLVVPLCLVDVVQRQPRRPQWLKHPWRNKKSWSRKRYIIIVSLALTHL